MATTLTVQVNGFNTDIASQEDLILRPVVAAGVGAAFGSIPGSPQWVHDFASSVVTVGSGGIATINFHTAFAHAVGTVVASAGDNAASLSEVIPLQSYLSLSGFSCLCATNTGVLIASGSTVRINWSAIGC